MGCQQVAVEVLREGARHRVCVLYPSDFWAYLDSLPVAAQRKVFALLEQCAQDGPPQHNREKCLKLKGARYAGIWELKSKPYRFLFFFRRRDLIITNWFQKQRDPGEHPEYDKACRRRRLYLSATEIEG